MMCEVFILAPTDLLDDNGAAAQPAPAAWRSPVRGARRGRARGVLAHRLDCVVLMNAAGVRVTRCVSSTGRGHEREAGTS